MARDAKVIQRGVNVQANDFAVPAGTPVRATNIDYSRDGVAARRVGFEDFWTGLPWFAIDESIPVDPFDDMTQVQRGFYELFSRDRLMHMEQGMIWARDKDADEWLAVPVNMPHRITFFGTPDEISGVLGTYRGFAIGIGRAIFTGLIPLSALNVSPTDVSPTPFRWMNDNPYGNFYGTPGNDASQANTAGSLRQAKFRQVSDMVATSVTGRVLSDLTSLRTSSGAVLAGSITAAGSTDGVGSAARFNGASWMATNGTSSIWIVDNVNEIRLYSTSSGSVTTFAGSTTAGDTDGVGTSARFRNISGITYDGSQFLYVTEGSSGNRVRRIDVNTASVTIFAGTLTSGVTGTTDGIGTAARFNNPTGIEYVSVSGTPFLFVGDTGNNRIRKIQVSTANVTTYTSSSTTINVDYIDGIVPGPVSSTVTPGVVLRGKYTAISADDVLPSTIYLCIECTTTITANTIDVALVDTESPGYSYHYVRCPSAYPNSTNGPIKLDTWGVNTYSNTSVRGVDVGGGAAFITSDKPRVLDVWTRLSDIQPMPRLRSLGVEAPEAPSCTTVAAGTTFANNTAWAYRTICGLTLPDGRIALGPPSERVIVTNTSGGTVNGSVTAFPSAGLPYDGMPFVQLYRTKTVSSSLDPGDQMFLAYETPLAYGSGAVITDIAPDANLGPELYTNATQPGAIAASSLPPPGFARELAAFNNRLVLSNIIPRSSIRVKVLGVTALTPSSSTITFTSSLNGPTYSGPFIASYAITLLAVSGATTPASNQFQIGSGGTAAANSAQTARNIVRCINRSPDAFLFSAVYDENDAGSFIVYLLYPGQTAGVKANSSSNFLFASGEDTNTQASVSFSSTDEASYNVVLSNVSTRNQNSVAYSDQNDFDSFPAGNTLNVGPSTESIQRLLPISERLLAVKDDSVFAIDETFSTQIYDAALSCSLPNSFAKVNNQWIGLFTRGFCALNSTQATAIGRPIDRDVTAQYRQFLSDTNGTDFASASAIDVSGNYVCTLNAKTYVYNVISQSWSDWQINSVVRQDSTDEGSFFNFASSGMRFIGAFDDTFVTNQPALRGVWRQRDWRRTGTEWFHDYSDMSWSLSDAVIGVDLQTITVASYSASSATSPLTVPPFNRTPPSGAVTAPGAADCDSRFVVFVSQSGNTLYTQGTVVAATPGSSSSAITIALSEALTSPFSSGSLTACTVYAPILVHTQYAPTVAPGQNVGFFELVVTTERVVPGWVQARFFGRKDLKTADIYADGLYDDDQGVRRAVEMSAIDTGEAALTIGKLAYNEVIRFEVASDRAFDQQLGVELWEANAWQPLAIKGAVVEYRPQENTKVNQ